MNREIDDQSLAAAESQNPRPFLTIELDYPDGAVRASSLAYNVVIDGNEFLGLSVLGTLSEITEGSEQQSYGVTATLAGVPGNFSAYLTNQDVQGRLATICLGFVNAKHQVIGEMTTVFVGRMDTQDIQAGKTSAVQVAIESLFIDWERPRSRRYTDVDQQFRYPGDVGFEYVAAVANMTIKWGAA